MKGLKRISCFMRQAFTFILCLNLSFIILGISWGHAAPLNSDAYPKPKGRYASIIVDTDNLDIIHARQIDDIRYPASLTKVMTLYLTFDALMSGELELDQKLTVSRQASKTPPTKLGLRTGQKITVDTLIRAVAVRSANDAAVVLAEHISGSEEAFAEKMTRQARLLGMKQTTFKTAHGLPHPAQLTTARDMAKLANAILVNHKRYFHYFGLETFEYRNRVYKNTNKLLAERHDVDGFKTGYTHASGYNLIVSAQQNGRRLIAVVLGGASGASRNSHMSDLIDRGFSVMGLTPQLIVQNNTHTPKPVAPPSSEIIRLRGQDRPIITQAVSKAADTQSLKLPNGTWSIQSGLFETKEMAQSHLQSLTLLSELDKAKPLLTSRGEKFAARMTGLTAQSARKACKVLEKSRHGCLIIGPSS